MGIRAREAARDVVRCCRSLWGADDLVEVDLGGTRTRGYREATTELDLHLRVYRRREDCGGVVHAHPPTATGFAVAGQGLPCDVLPEIALLMGEVPCVPYATAGTPALGDAVEPFLDGRVALLLANHGALTWGRDLAQARIRMEVWSMAPGFCWQPVLSAG